MTTTTVIIFSVAILLLMSLIFSGKNKKLKKSIKELEEKNKRKDDTVLDSYKKTIQEVKEIIKGKPLRTGYYKYGLKYGTDNINLNTKKLPFDTIVYVNELDRYKNGKSKIELSDIEIEWTHFKSKKPNKNIIYDFIVKHFISLVETSDIEWLESEENIKEIRKEKINKLKEIIEKNK